MAIATKAVIALAIAKAKTSLTAFPSPHPSLSSFTLLPKTGQNAPPLCLTYPFLPPLFYRTLHGINAEALGTTPSEVRQQHISGDSHENKKTRKQVYWCTIGTGRSPEERRSELHALALT